MRLNTSRLLLLSVVNTISACEAGPFGGGVLVLVMVAVSREEQIIIISLLVCNVYDGEWK
jgi:Na+/serine symporter